MQESNVMVLDERDLKYVGVLVDAGFSPGEARVMVALSLLGVADMKGLVAATCMSQSAICMACSKLKGYGIIAVDYDAEHPLRGRKISGVRIAGDLVDLVSKHMRQRARVEQIKLGAAARQYRNLGIGGLTA